MVAPAFAERAEGASSSRRALTEMRSLLGILRDPDAPAPRTPAPRLAGITELVQQSRRSGLSVRLVGAELLIDDDRDEAVGVAGFRIVQEALSNVIRHAPGAEAEVRITRGADLQIVVANTAPSLPLSAQRVEEGGGGQGAGLLGMRERAAAAGGTVVWGPDASGGCEVRLALPLTHAHVSASRSMLDWIEAGRRPLVADSRYAAEMEALRPGLMTRYAADALPDLLADAWRRPARTWLPDGADLRPSLDDAAAQYVRWWRTMDAG